jgi:hypothetical protein
MPVRQDALVFLLPAALAGLGLGARAAAGAAFSAFVGYRAPFRFAAVPQQELPALSERVVLVILDGLGAADSRRMAFLNELRGRGASQECRAGLPSLSLPARAVLMTGAWQSVNGQTTNYEARPLEVEHLFQIAHAHGRATALLAGAKTQALFAPHVTHAVVYDEAPETASMEVHEVAHRRALAASLALLDARPALAQLELYLADDAGHGWGSRSPEYERALTLLDEAVRALAGRVDLERETLVVTSDHGHVAGGGHGGPEPEVLQVPLVLAGRGVRRGISGACAQVDVAPTLAVLMGLPLPAAAQGTPLFEALDLSPDQRRDALRNTVAQRQSFVSAYARQLAALGQEWPTSDPVALSPDEGETALGEWLAALAADETRAAQDRLGQEAAVRWRRAAAVAALTPALLGLLLWTRVLPARETGRAALFALAAAAAYHLLLPVAGLSYSLSAVNKDEWLQGFFLKDMALGVLVCAAALAASCRLQRHRGAGLLALCRQAWLCATVFCALFVLKAAFVYARHPVVPRWSLADQYWGMAFYLDVLVVMAVGFAAPAFALIAGLVWIVPAAADAAPAAG